MPINYGLAVHQCGPYQSPTVSARPGEVPMPAGDVALRDSAVPAGYARVETGVLVKVVPTCGPVGSTDVFTPRDVQRLDDVIAEAENATGLRFAAYVGDLGADSR